MARGVDPIGSVVRNLFAVQRMGNAIVGEGQVLLDALHRQIADDLMRINPAGPALHKWQMFRTENFLGEVGKRVRDVMPEWEKTVKAGLAQAGRTQGKISEAMLITTLGRSVGKGVVRQTPVTQGLVRTILNTEPFGGAKGQHVLSEWAKGLELATRERIVSQIRLGMTLEESIPQMVRRIRGTQHGYIKNALGKTVPNFVGGVYTATTRDAEAIVRTAVTFVTNTAHLETFRANAHVLAGVQYSATLDDRTTEVCLALDGTVWAVDDPAIVVPGDTTHVGCRSQLIPVPDYAKFGLDQPPEGLRMARDLSGLKPEDLARKVSARRGASLLGKQTRVGSSTTAERWLRDQPVRVQDKMLGKGKAQLFRDGQITLKDLVRQDRTVVPLRELRVPDLTKVFKTTQAAEVYLKGRYPGLEVGFGGIDTSSATAVTRAIDAAFTRFPALRQEVRSVAARRVKAGYAEYDYSRLQLNINTASFRTSGKLTESIGQSVTAGWAPKGTASLQYVPMHELGHAMMTVAQKNPTIRARVQEFMTRKAPASLSQYAATSPVEGWAEAFAQAMLAPRSSWDSYTRELWEILRGMK